MMATQELRFRTGCPISWAKLWVEHSGRPDSVGTTAPCPYCGRPLITALAKQCHHCFIGLARSAASKITEEGNGGEPGARSNPCSPPRNREGFRGLTLSAAYSFGVGQEREARRRADSHQHFETNESHAANEASSALGRRPRKNASGGGFACGELVEAVRRVRVASRMQKMFLQEVAESAEGKKPRREEAGPTSPPSQPSGRAPAIGKSLAFSRSSPRRLTGSVSQIASCPPASPRYLAGMPLTADLAKRLKRLSPREKAALADHLWREAESKLGPTSSQLAMLDERAAAALRTPAKTKPSGHALRRLRR